MGNYTLWCLNQVADWDRRRLADALAVKGRLSKPRHVVALGHRARFDREPDWEEKLDPGEPRRQGGTLMHEHDAPNAPENYNEYFVPIVVKCVGDPERFRGRFADKMTDEGKRRFETLLRDFATYFAPVEPANPGWRGYWDGFSIANALWNVEMFSRPDGPDPFVGYYEMVADSKATTGPAVLVGYSQGGVVAQFLTWMDEYLMDEKHRSIAGVLTVQSPNHGSPFANLDSAPSVAIGLAGALAGLIGYPIVGGQDPKTRAALQSVVVQTTPGSTPVGLAALCVILDGLIGDVPPGKTNYKNVVRTARKWLTGLVPLGARRTLAAASSSPQAFPDLGPPIPLATAFADLDPRHLDDPTTILGRLVTLPVAKVFHGAIIGADTGLEDLVEARMNCLERLLVHRFIANELFATVETAYARIAMDEAAAGVAKGPLHRQLASLFQTGMKQTAVLPALDPFAHDFIIPSVSQAFHVLAPPTGDARAHFLGNVVNPNATHISGGGDEKDSGSDSPAVRAMLRKLGNRLA